MAPRVMSVDKSINQPVGTFHHPTKKSYRTGKCPIGKIERVGYHKKGYTRKDGSKVKGSFVPKKCIKNLGLPGKVAPAAKVIPPLHQGDLTSLGYHAHLNENSRFKALKKAVKKYGYKSTISKINAIRNLSKSNPELFKIYSQDIKDLQEWHNSMKPKTISSSKKTKSKK